MATSKADILISIKPEYMALILSRAKDHEFRKCLIPPTVQRMWFYVSSPEQSLLHIAEIGPARRPGELEPSGTGNDAFNKGEMDATHAYPILHLYKLPRPLGLKQLKEQFGVGPPRKYAFLKGKLKEQYPSEELEKVF